MHSPRRYFKDKDKNRVSVRPFIRSIKNMQKTKKMQGGDIVFFFVLFTYPKWIASICFLTISLPGFIMMAVLLLLNFFFFSVLIIGFSQENIFLLINRVRRFVCCCCCLNTAGLSFVATIAKQFAIFCFFLCRCIFLLRQKKSCTNLAVFCFVSSQIFTGAE